MPWARLAGTLTNSRDIERRNPPAYHTAWAISVLNKTLCQNPKPLKEPRKDAFMEPLCRGTRKIPQEKYPCLLPQTNQLRDAWAGGRRPSGLGSGGVGLLLSFSVADTMFLLCFDPPLVLYGLYIRVRCQRLFAGSTRPSNWESLIERVLLTTGSHGVE